MKLLMIIIAILGVAKSRVPIYLNLPFDTVSYSGELIDENGLTGILLKVKETGFDGVVVDVWWGIVEKQPKTYNFEPYKQLLQIIQAIGLKAQVIMSFHKCGTTFRDDCDFPLPDWVLSEKEHDILYKDLNDSISESYISLFASEEPLFGFADAKRNAYEIYNDYMVAFRDEFRDELNSLITVTYIGMGPASQLRYPSYRYDKNGYCGVGDFQNHDKYAQTDLRESTINFEKAIWQLNEMKRFINHSNNIKSYLEKKGIEEYFNYNKKPFETNFFRTRNKNCYIQPLYRRKCEADSMQDCFDKGCCWDHNDQHVQCFQKVIDECSATLNRIDCGNLESNRESCQAKGCCWDARQPNLPHCFYSNPIQNYESEYAKFFLDWYETKLLEHGERMSQMAREIFQTYRIALKLPSVFWMAADPSRAAELTAGYNNHNDDSFYAKVMRLAKRHEMSLTFSGFELTNAYINRACLGDPEGLVNEIKRLSALYFVDLIGEPAFDRGRHNRDYDTIIKQLPGLYQFIPLRLKRIPYETDEQLKSFIKQAHNTPRTPYYSFKRRIKKIIAFETNDCEKCYSHHQCLIEEFF